MALFVTAAWLRFAGLGRDELWLDEAETANQVALPATALFESFAHDNKPPLFYLALHGWTRLAGETEWALRLPSAFAGLATVLLLGLLGRRLAGERAGLAAAAWCALSPLAILYAQEARNHAPTACLVVLAFWCLARALERGRRRDWAFYTFAVAAALMTQYSAAPALLAGAALLVPPAHRAARRSYLLASLTGLLPLLPWAVVIARQVQVAASTVSWLVPYWQAYPPALAIPLSFRAFMPGGDVPIFVALATPPNLQIALAVGAGLVLLVAWLPGKNRFLEASPPNARAFALAVCFLPLLAQWLVSWTTPIYMVGRTDFVAFPGFCLLAGLAFARLRSSWVQGLAVAMFLVASGFALLAAGATPPFAGQREPMARLADSLDSGDLLISTGLSRPSTQYYLRRAAPEKSLKFVSYPLAMEGNPATFNPATFAARPEELQADARDLSALVTEATSNQRVLLLWVDDPIHLPLLDALEPCCRLVPWRALPSYRLNHLGTQIEVFEVRPRR